MVGLRDVGHVRRRTRAERLKHGIPLDDTTLGEMIEAAVSLGMGREDVAARIAGTSAAPA